MVDETWSAFASQVGVDARIELSGGASLTSPVTEIEPTDRGIRIGMLFFPWHRVLRYWLDLPSKGGRSSAPSDRVHVRIVLEDGSPEGEAHVVTAEQFEAGPWTLNLIAETASEDGTRTLRRKLCVPWHSVREYERLTAAGSEASDEETVVIPEAD
jgi:hypothetical protein